MFLESFSDKLVFLLLTRTRLGNAFSGYILLAMVQFYKCFQPLKQACCHDLNIFRHRNTGLSEYCVSIDLPVILCFCEKLMEKEGLLLVGNNYHLNETNVNIVEG